MAIRIGCGSWADPEYVGLLYPKKTPATERLQVYTRWFERVELNTLYHALPPRERVAGWVAQTPPGFRFDVKLPKDFSIGPQAAARGDIARRFLDTIEPILSAQKVGAFLLTLAPSFTPERHRLTELTAAAALLQPHAPVAVELRNRGWVDGPALAKTLDFFRAHQLAWVALDLPSIHAPAILPPIDEVTHPTLAYMRLHGRNPDYLHAKTQGERHRHDYSAAELKQILVRIQSLAARAAHVHVSVNNHCEAFAPKAALALRRLLGQPVPPPLADRPDDDGQLSLLT